MYSIDAICFFLLGLVTTGFGIAYPSLPLIFIGLAATLYGVYEGMSYQPKVLDTSKYKRRFMTDNSMAYVAIDGSKKYQNNLYGYALFIGITALTAMLSGYFLIRLTSVFLCFASIMMLCAWIFRGETDIFWLPGESHPIRIFYNESKFEPERKRENKEEIKDNTSEPNLDSKK